MPQMAPINWLSLFIMFSLIFLFFNILNYYNFFINPIKIKSLDKNNSTNYLNWKW
uniref:ATP synthase complex subunit 8 n=1 Tax=Dynatosoma fuscicorne TaxID=2339868 RepID=A0A7L7S8V8_9DIPT|nr:ATP synthase F0 subunit 8 [Dynatosoma fuscicorne]